MGETIGFIGLGTMGFPMMSQLAKAGVKIVAYDTESSVLRRAAEVPGVQAAAHPREATHCSTVVFTCLPNDQIVNNVYMGKDGILEAAREGLITCDCSTVFPDTTLALAAALRRKGTIHMDTTMLGSKPQAETGEVFFIVGGDETALPRIKPAIDIMGRMHIYAGPSGSANKVKLIHNALGNLNYAAAAEAGSGHPEWSGSTDFPSGRQERRRSGVFKSLRRKRWDDACWKFCPPFQAVSGCKGFAPGYATCTAIRHSDASIDHRAAAHAGSRSSRLW